MDPLATPDDVVKALGRELTNEEEARVDHILAKASALFRDRSGQDFTIGESTVRLKVNGRKVYLPQIPIITVLSVTDDHGCAIDYELFGQWLTTCLGSHRFVRVHYTHGAEEVPDLVRLTIAEIAKKVLSINPNAASGVTQHSETRGPFTESDTYATWAQGGQTMLAPDDDAIALRYNFRPPNLIVTRP